MHHVLVFKDETETMPGLQMGQEKLFMDSRLGEYYGIRV